jgi:hypothetical protein
LAEEVEIMEDRLVTDGEREREGEGGGEGDGEGKSLEPVM